MRHGDFHYISSLRLIAVFLRISSISVVIAFRFYFFFKGRASNIIVRVFFIQRWRLHAICSTTSIASCLFFFLCTQTVAIEDKRFVYVRKITLFAVIPR